MAVLSDTLPTWATQLAERLVSARAVTLEVRPGDAPEPA